MAEIGEVNSQGQRLAAVTQERGNHPFARVWILECTEPTCRARYGANSCDFHIRKCPEPHAGGRPGLAIPS